MIKKYFYKMEIIGVFFSLVLSVVLHYTYNISNGSVWSIMFGAVNESLWEHIKIITFPYLVWAFVEVAIAKPYFKQFVVSKIIGIYGLGVCVLIFYYAYSTAIGCNILWVDITSVVVFNVLAYVASYKITLSSVKFKIWYNFALALLFLYFCMYFWFTVSPPKNPIFLDNVTGEYGIYARSALDF